MIAEHEPAAEWVDVESLVPWDKNPRVIKDRHVQQVVESIKRFGWSAPVIARKADRVLIAGHTRLAAAKQLGITKVPVRWMDIDPADARLLAIGDNKLAEDGEWDEQALAELLGPLMMSDADLAAVAGFTDKDIAKLLKATADEVLGEAPDQTAVLGQRFEIIIECEGEEQQRSLLDDLMDKGLKCRALI